MDRSWWWRLALVVGVTLGAIWFLIPSYYSYFVLPKEQRNNMRTWTQRIMEHLLLLEHSPATDPRPHWTGEIVDFRTDIERRLSNALRRDLRRQLSKLYEGGRRAVTLMMEAHVEKAAAEQLPASCSYELEQVLGDWWPEKRQELW